MSIFERFFRRGVWLFVLVSWLIIGNIFFWPLLTRAMLLYTALIITSMIRSRSLASGERELQRALSFWTEGLDRVNGILSANNHPVVMSTGIAWRDIRILAIWSVSCGVFWLAVARGIHAFIRG